MQAVILAGGLGTRLGELTRDTPKVMLHFAGRPFLYYIIRLLGNQGTKEIVICAGYLGKQVKNFFGNGHKLGVNIKYSEESVKLLGTGGALKQAQAMLDRHFLVLNGDTYLPINYRKVEEEYLRLGRKALMVVYNNKADTGVTNNIALDRDKMVVRYDKDSTLPDLRYVEAGAIVLQKETLDFVVQGTKVSLEEGIYRHLIERREMAVYITRQRFYDIGTPEQRQVFEDFVKGAA
ncbi:MAG: D-glycero-D-manno-heptose 1-phosphate guanosyltransferase [Dehalococcoidia bacterium]|nr:MAG: D-glycero-D-manno-heptose 1-phosphate guanosyltransferase [Dehalococcoidia bacterium]